MEDKLNINEINKMPIDAHGTYTVQLFDAVTGELIQEEVKKNRINPNLAMFHHHNIYGAPLVNLKSNSIYNTIEYIPRFLHVYNNDEDPAAGGCTWRPLSGSWYGCGEVYVADNGDYRLSFNSSESSKTLYYDEDGRLRRRHHFVFDASTSQCNGTLNTLMLRNTGNAGGGLVSLYNYSESTLGYNSSYSFRHGLNCLIDDAPDYIKALDATSGMRVITSYDIDGNVWVSPAPATSSSDGIYYSPVDMNNADKPLVAYKFSPDKRLLGKVVFTLPDTLLGLTTRGLTAAKVGDKFFVLKGYSSTYKLTDGVQTNGSEIYVFDANGNYEQTVETFINTVRPSSFDSSYVLGTPFGLFCATGITNPYSTNIEKPQLRVIGTDGLEKNKINLFADEYYENVLTGNSYPYTRNPVINLIKNGDTWQIKITALEGNRSANSNANGGYCGIVYDYKSNTWVYQPLDEVRFPLTSYTNNIFWSDGLIVNYYDEYGFREYIQNIWYSWCKLDSPVVKTANTTMKIQYDFDVPVTHPSDFGVPLAPL